MRQAKAINLRPFSLLSLFRDELDVQRAVGIIWSRNRDSAVTIRVCVTGWAVLGSIFQSVQTSPDVQSASWSTETGRYFLVVKRLGARS